jgi:hypothetical protein
MKAFRFVFLSPDWFLNGMWQDTQSKETAMMGQICSAGNSAQDTEPFLT